MRLLVRLMLVYVADPDCARCRLVLVVLVSRSERWGTTFEFYDSNGQVEPPFLERKGSHSSGGVRDYHWTAANTFYLLHRPNATLP